MSDAGPLIAMPSSATATITLERSPDAGWTRLTFQDTDPVEIERLVSEVGHAYPHLDFNWNGFREPGDQTFHAVVFFRYKTSEQDLLLAALKQIYAMTREDGFPMHLAADIDQIIVETAGLNTEEW